MNTIIFSLLAYYIIGSSSMALRIIGVIVMFFIGWEVGLACLIGGIIVYPILLNSIGAILLNTSFGDTLLENKWLIYLMEGIVALFVVFLTAISLGWLGIDVSHKAF